ncbi:MULTISPECIES: rhamnogalacturonan acetylesterase [Chryseobacterium]|uniref:Lysophospholipase L1-like esterase n=1 Tax=Chryseobacterium geocarposphaerae TaxID=1416776 RepID=A0ABU1L8X1_9FLAO|nr:MULTISPECIES: rhamnogalacturonan acetylesterase [Chryseobacterium]MDR6403171.1 lysophospholipase L1-like esterase [Chryseobacterium geocarposphaerae]MDR6696726.1 lysophospholipase L1-like esterase [Chryseobacterium ginsenosidimutans]
MKNWIKILTLFLSSFLFAQQTSFKFDFGGSRTENGFIPVTSTSKFDKKTGYGFMDISGLKSVDNGGNALTGDYLTSDKPFYFSVVIPEGNYDIKLSLGDSKGTSETTVRVENRRLMLDDVKTKQGEIIEKIITVHVKDSIIRNQNGVEIGIVKLKPRERKYLHWDNLLTIEFNDKAPKVCALTIQPNKTAKTIYLTGDSTVVDALYEPWASWGQMLPYFFVPKEVVIANYAESGETLKAFEDRHRIDKIWNKIKSGDYLFIQFGHNDQKSGNSTKSGYRKRLKEWIQKAKQLGANPVLVTSMNRRVFDENDKIVNTLDDFPDAMREIAKEEKVYLIDLNAMSKTLFEAMGPGNSKKAFVYYPANSYPNQPNVLADDTHFNTYGAYELAKCVVKSIVDQKLPLSKFVSKNYKGFDLNKPDAVETFHWPESVFMEALKPDGN